MEASPPEGLFGNPVPSQVGACPAAAGVGTPRTILHHHRRLIHIAIVRCLAPRSVRLQVFVERLVVRHRLLHLRERLRCPVIQHVTPGELDLLIAQARLARRQIILTATQLRFTLRKLALPLFQSQIRRLQTLLSCREPRLAIRAQGILLLFQRGPLFLQSLTLQRHPLLLDQRPLRRQFIGTLRRGTSRRGWTLLVA